ncbi:MAG: metallophosphoesterase, partial [Selenomonadaceae bacterium]|nr:metallophosphoesterase [Selenomonadaceae bacterium]
AFMGAFDALGIDLVLTGHLHTYRNRHHIFAGKPADHGPAYVLCGLAGDQRYPGIWIDPVFDKVTAPQPETDNYLTLDAASETLRLRCYLPDGTVIDDMTLSHAR